MKLACFPKPNKHQETLPPKIYWYGWPGSLSLI